MIGLQNILIGGILSGGNAIEAATWLETSQRPDIDAFVSALGGEITSSPSVQGQWGALVESRTLLEGALAADNPEEIAQCQRRLAKVLKNPPPGLLAGRPNLFDTSKAAAAKAATVISAAQDKANREYRASLLYVSGGPAIPIPGGLSQTVQLPTPKGPKVLFLAHFPLDSNGSGTYTRAMADFLTKGGAAVRILFAGYRLEENLVPHYLVPFTPTEGKALDGAALAPLPVIDSNPSSPDGKRFKDLTSEELLAYTEGFADAVRVAVNHFDPDVLVVNHAWVGAEAAKRSGKPYVVFCHGTCLNHMYAAFPGGPRDRIHKGYPPNLGALVFPGVQKASRVITASDGVHREIPAKYGVDPTRVFALPHGFSSDIFFPQPDLDRNTVLRELGLSLEGVTHVVAYAGRMADIKGVATLIQAAKTVKSQMFGVHFVLAGSGRQLKEYQALASRLGVDDVVHFVGKQPQPTLAKIHSIADVGVVPSRSELFGLSALEIAGTGTPVIASDVGGLKQVVKDAIGFRVPPNNPQALAEEIMRVLKDDTKAKRGQGIASHARGNFTWAYTGMELEHHLKEAIREDRERKDRKKTSKPMAGAGERSLI